MVFVRNFVGVGLLRNFLVVRRQFRVMEFCLIIRLGDDDPALRKIPVKLGRVHHQNRQDQVSNY